MFEEGLENAGADEALPKEQLKKRWLRKYPHALEQRNHKQNYTKSDISAIGQVVILKDDVKDKA